MTPISFVRPVVSDEAKAFGLYPKACEASITFKRTFFETEAPSVNVRDTAERDTPAISATSFKVTAIHPLPSVATILARIINHGKAPS